MPTSRCFHLPADHRSEPAASRRAGEEGYMLLAALVAVFLVLLALSVAAPTVARALRREREVEAMNRANQYTRAIQLYYRRFNSYPGSLEQLEKSNQIRFLRERYPDPMTGKADWRLIKVGENKTTVKGFFGQPLGGVASTGLGTAAGMASSGGTGTPAGTMGGSSSIGAGSSLGGSSPFGTSSIGSSSPTSTDSSGSDSSAGASGGSGASGVGSLGSMNATSGSTGTNAGAGISSQSATSITGTNGAFLGVGLPVSGSSVLTVNEKTSYPEWEFLYDPRIEQLRANVNILGGGMSTTTAGSLGSAGSLSSGTNGSSPTGATSPTSSFGSSSFGSSSFGSSSPGSSTDGGTSTPSTPSSSPQ